MTEEVGKALFALGVKGWVLRGEPTTEAEFNSMFRKVIGEDSNGTGIESDDHTKFGATWAEITTKMDELKKAEPMILLRKERDKKLLETDWWALGDITMTDAQKKYRQDLRDITKTATSLEDVTWPTKP